MMIDQLLPLYDVIDIAPQGWPIHCAVAIPNARALEHWPDYPAAALPQAGRIGSGCGTDVRAARLAAVGEAVEIASLSFWGDEATTRVAGDGATYRAEDLLGFSAEQLGDRDGWNRRLAGGDHVPAGHRLQTSEWVCALAASNADSVFVPADLVYLDFGNEVPSMADTNGCAAAADPETARLKALLEAIERDATGRWWYGQRQRPVLPQDGLDSAAALFDDLQAFGLAPCLIDITTDIGVPVVAARGTVKGRFLALGFSAGMTVEEAATKALTEMAQMALKIEGAAETGQADRALTAWMMEVRPESEPLVSGMASKTVEPRRPLTGLDKVLHLCAGCSVRIAFVDQTRPGFGLDVWRVLSPDLCHWKPRLGRSRLLAPDAGDIRRRAGTNPVLLRI